MVTLNDMLQLHDVADGTITITQADHDCYLQYMTTIRVPTFYWQKKFPHFLGQ